MKIKHHTLTSIKNINNNKIDWNKLRNSSSEFDYYIPSIYENYLNLIEKLGPPNNFLFESLKKYIIKNDIKKIVSIGAGRCVLEFHLKKDLNIEIIVTDSDVSIDKIKSFNIFDQVFILDPTLQILPFEVTSDTLFLLCRIDTEFDDLQLKNLFKILFLNKVNHICFVPASVLNFKTVLVELKIIILSFFSRRQRIFCGYSRSKSSFLRSWSNFYQTIFDKNGLKFLNKK